MKKLKLLTVTGLILAGIGGQTLTAQAANVVHNRLLPNGGRVIVAYGSNCNIQNIQSILDQLENCFPNITVPEETPEELPEDEHAFIREVVNLVNIERAKEGLSPLTIDTKVQAAAMVRAKECEQSFSHTRPDGSSFATALKEQNVSYTRAGENIAWGQRSPEEVMTAWMNSSGHRANIMNPNFTTIGVGYYENAKGTDYWCQLFTR